MIAYPKISVILTSYNHGKYLRESIQSVLEQTYQDYELIILDDASTDNSWEIINSYADPRIRSFRNEVNRTGIRLVDAISKLSFGEFIAIHHSDDIWEPKKLEKQILFLENNPHIGAVFSLVNVIDEGGQPFVDETHKYYKVFEQPNRTRHEWLNYFFFNGNALCHPSVLIHKRCYPECGYFRKGFAQLPDLDFWIRLCMKYEIYILQEKLVRFRIRADEKNTSGNRPEIRVRDHFERFHLLNTYQSISSVDDLLMIFPTAKNFLNASNIDIRYVLGRVAVDSGPTQVHKLFGLNLIFEAMNDPQRAKNIRECHQFELKDFIKLTGEHDIFSTEASYIARQELTNTRAWKIVEDTRRLRNRIAPPGSRRSQLFNGIKSKSYGMLLSISQYRKNREIVECISNSKHFDGEYYFNSYPDLASLEIDPVVHYCKSGWKEGRNPNPYFDTNLYLSRHHEIITLDICPLYHWIKNGENVDDLNKLANNSYTSDTGERD